MGWGLVYGV